MKRVLVVVGTRPEAIKVGPVVRAAVGSSTLALDVMWTGQHTDLLAPHAAALRVAPPRGPADGADPRALRIRLQDALEHRCPDAVLGQGDTTSVVVAAEVSANAGVPFVHLEAGLRSGRASHPWPEESNRVRVAELATLHLAPTQRASANLVREGVDPAAVVVTGNTIVDAVTEALAGLGDSAPTHRVARFDDERTRVLFTHHRRESFPDGAHAVFRGVRAVAEAHPGVEVVLPTHPNPSIAPFVASLRGLDNVRCIEALDHRELLWLMRRCRFVITDSGGIQEEAPSVALPAIVTREATERPETIERGWATLVGWSAANIEASARRWLCDDDALRRARPRGNPFGDGHAAPRCLQALRCLLGISSLRPEPWLGNRLDEGADATRPTRPRASRRLLPPRPSPRE